MILILSMLWLIALLLTIWKRSKQIKKLEKRLNTYNYGKEKNQEGKSEETDKGYNAGHTTKRPCATAIRRKLTWFWKKKR
jgi:hypothetical protein